MKIPQVQKELSDAQMSLDRLAQFLAYVAANADPFSAHVRKSRRRYHRLKERKRPGHDYGRDLDSCVKSTYAEAKQLGYLGTELEWAAVLIPDRPLQRGS